LADPAPLPRAAPELGVVPPPAPFFGWRVIAAVFVMLAFSSGLGFYNLAVFLEALTASHGFSVSVVSAATGLYFAVSALAGVLVADLIQRFDPRFTIVVGSVLGACALLLLGRVGAPSELFAVYALYGIGFSCVSLVPGTTLVTRWFLRRRALAMAVASTGLSVGGVVLTPLSAALVARVGLASATPWLALAFVLGIVPICLLWVRPDPAALGQQPDGDAQPRSAELPGAELGSALVSRFFLFATAAYVFVMLGQVGAIAHQFKLVSDRVDAATAAGAVSLMAAFSVAGRLAGGWLVPRVSIRIFVVLLIAGQSAFLLVMGLGSNALVLLVGIALFGLTVGNLLMLQPLLLAEAFGVRNYSRIYSVANVVTTLGVAGGPVLVGAIYDVVGGYERAFALASGASLLAAALLLAAGPLPRS
jgi:MFS family permease